MTDKKKDNRNKGSKPADTDASLQEELSRETAEGADSIGDVGRIEPNGVWILVLGDAAR
jgi:hypothetical protein